MNETASNDEVREKLVKDGHVAKEVAAAGKKMFAMMDSFFETRQCLAGISGQNLLGLAKHITTLQHDRPLPDRTSAEWYRLRVPLGSEAESAAALAFLMDAALSFLPLNLDKKNFEDAGVCSTLDFALRIMVPGFELHKWHLRERRTIAAAVGRSYSEGRFWDESGRLVCVANQTSIIRPVPHRARM